MSGSNHVAGGVVFTGVFLSMYDVNIFSSPSFIFFTGFFSLLPDADHTKSFIGKLIYPIAKLINRKYGHRTITHSLMFYIAGYIIVSFIEKATTTGTIISRIYLWAYGSHLIFDMLTKQGIPLFYPFKKNPCVMPANPIYRLRASDLKTEATIFLVFGLIAFTCKNLFAHGFWNTYNSAFDNVKHVYEEQRKFDGVISVDYYFKDIKGRGNLVDVTPSDAVILNDKTGFIKVTDAEKIKTLKPIRTKLQRQDFQKSFNDISIDSFRNMIKDKAILDLKVQSALPLSFSKNNEPQSTTSINLSYVMNPVFKSSDIDSLDQTTIKDISLIRLQIQENNFHVMQWKAKKERSIKAYNDVQEALKSDDLAVREKAIKEQQKAKSEFENITEPINNSEALETRLNFLQSKSHIKKTQKISGFISYITFN
ncbi:MAG: metal-dependent hydrolase [Bacteroidota bacterium]|nr:metal-dependent hydrolase [Bacteroidota bacterium]